MLSNIFRTVASIAASAVAAELRKPENQQKLTAAAQQVAVKLRDPETAQTIGSIANRGARALGRTFGNLKNR